MAYRILRISLIGAKSSADVLWLRKIVVLNDEKLLRTSSPEYYPAPELILTSNCFRINDRQSRERKDSMYRATASVTVAPLISVPRLCDGGR